MIHLDNAATSFPKPRAVRDAVATTLESVSGSARRGASTAALEAGSVLDASRARVAHFLGCSDPSRLAFTLNATDAISLALRSLAVPGSRIVTSAVEHAAVARTLRRLEMDGGCAVVRVTPRTDGVLDVDEIARAARDASMVVLTCASNVTAALQPWEEVARALRPRGTPLLLDASQAAGSAAIDFDALGPRTALAFTGHKALLGPMGVGGLIVGRELALDAWREGGTGDSGERQPESMPERLEAGTHPLPAIAGLAAGVAWWHAEGEDRVREREAKLGARMVSGLRAIAGVTVVAPVAASPGCVPLATFLLARWRPDDVAAVLDADYGITVRAGLHCAPEAHRHCGTWPEGAVRASVGPTTEPPDVEALLAAMAEIARG